MAGTSKNPNPGKQTPDDDWTWWEDSRSKQGSGKYPDYMSYKSRSGHNMIFDDTKGEESVTIQHRGGSAIQMRPDGSVHIVAHNSMYSVVFGENRMTVTGAHDITVKGDASLRVYGDLNETVHGNYNLTVNGDYNVVAKNHNRHIRGNIDTHAKNETKKVEGSSALMALGGIAHVANGPVSYVSKKGEANLGGSNGVNIRATKTKNVNISSASGDVNIKAEKGSSTMDAGKDVGITAKSGKASLTARSGAVHIKSPSTVYMDAPTTGVNQGGSEILKELAGNLFNAKGTPVQMAMEEPDLSNELKKYV